MWTDGLQEELPDGPSWVVLRVAGEEYGLCIIMLYWAFQTFLLIKNPTLQRYHRAATRTS